MVVSYKFRSRLANVVVFLAGLVSYVGQDNLLLFVPSFLRGYVPVFVLLCGYVVVQLTEDTRVSVAEELVREESNHGSEVCCERAVLNDECVCSPVVDDSHGGDVDSSNQNVVTSTSEVDTSTQKVVTPSGEVVTSTQKVVTPGGDVGTSNQKGVGYGSELDTSSIEVVTPTQNVVTPPDELDTPTQNVDTPNDDVDIKYDGGA